MIDEFTSAIIAGITSGVGIIMIFVIITTATVGGFWEDD